MFFLYFFLWSWCILTSQVEEVFVFHQANKRGLYFTAVRHKLTRSREHKPPTHITHHDRDTKANTGLGVCPKSAVKFCVK